jgi:hypothetical protein
MSAKRPPEICFTDGLLVFSEYRKTFRYLFMKFVEMGKEPVSNSGPDRKVQ